MGKVADAALLARDILAEPGVWVNESPDDKKNQHCVLTAGLAAMHHVGLLSNERVLFDDLVDIELQERGFKWEEQFNDAPGRSLEDVLDFWDEVAREAKERGL